MKALRIILYCSGGILVLLFVEGVCTLGTAFEFERYNIFAWIVQALFIICALATAIMMALADDANSKKRKPIEF